MPKQRSGWRSRLFDEVRPMLDLARHYVEIGDVGNARLKFEKVLEILRKPRICRVCGEVYYHDEPSTFQCCDECEHQYHDDVAREETPEERRDSGLEGTHD